VFERKNLAEIGVIGGSGFYELLTDVEHHTIQTPYGPPSGTLAIGSYEATGLATAIRRTRSTTGPTSGRWQRSA
jgi:5'-methylthioadenosine phosphorylase